MNDIDTIVKRVSSKEDTNALHKMVWDIGRVESAIRYTLKKRIAYKKAIAKGTVESLHIETPKNQEILLTIKEADDMLAQAQDDLKKAKKALKQCYTCMKRYDELMNED